MDGTCKKEKCIFWEQHNKDGKVCPFYCETQWRENDRSQIKVVEDCAPLRAIYMQMDDHIHTFGLKQLANEIRNTIDVLKSETAEFMHAHGREISSLKRNTEQVLLEVSKGNKNDVQAISDLRS